MSVESLEDGSSQATHPEDLDVTDASFICPDPPTFCRLDELGLTVVRQRLEPDRAVLAYRDRNRRGVPALRLRRRPATP